MKGLIQLLLCATVLVCAGVLPFSGTALAQSVPQPDTVNGDLGAFFPIAAEIRVSVAAGASVAAGPSPRAHQRRATAR